MNLHQKKRSLLDNVVYTSPRKKPIRKYNIEPLPMNDLQQIAKDISKPEQVLQPINHIQQIVSDISNLNKYYNP